MDNLFERILQQGQYCRQFKCGNSLITAFHCPIEVRLVKSRFADYWTQHNSLFYVIEGGKIWHTASGVYDVQQGSCFFVRKGGFVLEQLMDTGCCVMLFFIPDAFIRETLNKRSKPLTGHEQHFESHMPIKSNETLKGFFLSMYSYFTETREPNPALLEIKFMELILNIADNAENDQLLAYFYSLLDEPQTVLLKRVMEDNFCYNLKLEAYAELSNRSLSAFKRDFKRLFGSTPGKWLLEKRLDHALRLLSDQKKTISEAVFECGFESNAHFSRAFKLRFGKAPSEIKRLPLGQLS